MNHFPKKTIEEKACYNIHHCHNYPITARNWTQPYFIIISCDPGEVSFGFCIIQCFNNGYVKTLAMERLRVKEKVRQEDGSTVIYTIRNLYNALDKYKTYHAYVNYVFIEQQIPGVRQSNHAIMHSLIAYYSLHLHNLPLLASIVLINPSLKGRVLGFHGRDNIKKDSAIKCKQLLQLFQDPFINFFESLTVQYDVADAYVQAYAILQLWGITVVTPSPFL